MHAAVHVVQRKERRMCFNPQYLNLVLPGHARARSHNTTVQRGMTGNGSYKDTDENGEEITSDVDGKGKGHLHFRA